MHEEERETARSHSSLQLRRRSLVYRLAQLPQRSEIIKAVSKIAIWDNADDRLDQVLIID
jgi:hypothetical protein